MRATRLLDAQVWEDSESLDSIFGDSTNHKEPVKPRVERSNRVTAWSKSARFSNPRNKEPRKAFFVKKHKKKKEVKQASPPSNVETADEENVEELLDASLEAHRSNRRPDVVSVTPKRPKIAPNPFLKLQSRAAYFASIDDVDLALEQPIASSVEKTPRVLTSKTSQRLHPLWKAYTSYCAHMDALDEASMPFEDFRDAYD